MEYTLAASLHHIELRFALDIDSNAIETNHLPNVAVLGIPSNRTRMGTVLLPSTLSIKRVPVFGAMIRLLG
jgi:hypothetical protein